MNLELKEPKSMQKLWNEATVAKLIKLIGEYECVWNKRSVFHKNQDTRLSAIQKIHEELNEPEISFIELKKKIYRLKMHHQIYSKNRQKNPNCKTPAWFKMMDAYMATQYDPAALQVEALGEEEVEIASTNDVIFAEPLPFLEPNINSPEKYTDPFLNSLPNLVSYEDIKKESKQAAVPKADFSCLTSNKTEFLKENTKNTTKEHENLTSTNMGVNKNLYKSILKPENERFGDDFNKQQQTTLNIPMNINGNSRNTATTISPIRDDHNKMDCTIKMEASDEEESDLKTDETFSNSLPEWQICTSIKDLLPISKNNRNIPKSKSCTVPFKFSKKQAFVINKIINEHRKQKNQVDIDFLSEKMVEDQNDTLKNVLVDHNYCLPQFQPSVKPLSVSQSVVYLKHFSSQNKIKRIYVIK